jgi:radical SAM superfamily enzyme YgiQ (UPF0313 family)
MFRPMSGYDFPPFRPPNEAGSALIRITRGCPWNKCEFCSMYKRVKFELKPLEVKNDVEKARRIYPETESIFLGDSDNLVHKDLPEIVCAIRKTFPEAKRITAYARAKTILRKKMEFLTAVRKAGLNRLHFGLESGDRAVLKNLCKGVTPEEMIEAGRKAKLAGFEVSFYVISGAGGKERWREHAVNSAKVLNEIEPHFIRLRTLTIQNGTPLKEKQEKGIFIIAPPLERLREVELFVRKLALKDCYLASDHLTNYLWAGGTIVYKGITGTLPGDKKAMLKTLSQAIEFIESGGLEVKDSNQLYEEGFLTAL